MKITTKRPKLYPSDNLVQVLVDDQIVLNLWPASQHGMRGYTNDRTAKFCRTIAEAKELAIQLKNGA